MRVGSYKKKGEAATEKIRKLMSCDYKGGLIINQEANKRSQVGKHPSFVVSS